MKTLLLNTEQTQQQLTVPLAIETLDQVFQQMGQGQVISPPKTHVDMSAIGHEAWCNAMPAYLQREGVGGLKWIGGFGPNASRQLPYIMGVILLTDPNNGLVKAILDARRISEYRTGALAAVFSRYLSRKPVKQIMIAGAGVQGQMAARCLHAEHPAAQIAMLDLDPQRIRRFQDSQRDKSLGQQLLACTDAAACAPEADLIVLLTTARQPFLKAEWISPGTTVLGMGSYQQIEGAFATGCDKLIPDSWEQAKHRGEIKPLVDQGLIGDQDLYAELTDVVAGRKKGRENDEERLLGLPIGLGAYDVALAEQVFQRAQAAGQGQAVSLQQT